VAEPATNRTAPAASPAVDAAPPVAPNLPRDTDARAARRVSQNILETLIFRGLSTPLALVLVVVQSRFLAPGGRGQFVLVVLSVTILSRLFGQLGLAVTNRMQQHGVELRRLVHRAFALAVVLGIGGGAAIVAWGHVQRGIGAELAAIGAVALVPNVVWQSVSGVLLGLGEVRLWNWIQALPPVLTLLGMLGLVVAYDGGVRGALVAWTLAHLITAAFALVATRRVWSPFGLDELLDIALARLAITMGAVQVVNLISYRVELFILDRYRGIGAVGIYSISMQAAEAIWLVAAAIATSVTAPAVREQEPVARRLIARSAFRGLAYTAVVAAVVGLAGPLLIPLLFGEDFRHAARPLALLLPGIVAYAPVSILVVYLSVRRGRPRLSLVVAVIGMLVTASVSVVLIPRHGASGAAAASTIGYVVAGALAWLFFARLARSGPKPSDIMRRRR
jgi:O-antigen/teichoic acid export membrane protein